MSQVHKFSVVSLSLCFEQYHQIPYFPPWFRSQLIPPWLTAASSQAKGQTARPSRCVQTTGTPLFPYHFPLKQMFLLTASSDSLLPADHLELTVTFHFKGQMSLCASLFKGLCLYHMQENEVQAYLKMLCIFVCV